MLEKTVGMMISDDYKERFKAEYWQTLYRQQKLYSMLVKYKAGTLGFKPSCPYSILEEQLRIMGNYLMILEARAEIEGIILKKGE